MKTVGFPISHKENENRRALVPDDILKITHPDVLWFEQGYGDVLGFCDEDYSAYGCNIGNREEVLKKDIICDPKIGDAEYLLDLGVDTTIFGWVHATQNRDITEKLIQGNLTVYAWEKMFQQGRHVFWRNNELAGEAAVLHAFLNYGKMPYETKAAVLGRGNTARGAIKVLNMLGATVHQYDRKTEQLFRSELDQYDVIVNCVLWDVLRKDHVVYIDDLKGMKHGALIIDVSCDHNGAIESSKPTTIENPTFFLNGIQHYAVDHTPSLFYKTFSNNNSRIISTYLNELIEENPGEVLKNAMIIEHGIIRDGEIIRFQGR